MRREELLSSEAFELIQKNAAFSIEKTSSNIDLHNSEKYTRIRLNSAQKMRMSGLLSQFSQSVETGLLSQAYCVKFPAGLPHTLTALKQGGAGSMVRENGKFAGSASFYSLSAQAVVFSAFTTMSAVTGQYFLTRINSELEIVNDKLDDILSFLYGEKKAELIAEIEFLKYAHDNFGSIMLHDQQCLATIHSLQEARKVAISDIEFYLCDLDAVSQKSIRDYSDLCNQTNKAFQIKNCIELSRQLYVMAGVLELFYAQNYDEDYINYIEQELIECINKCDNRIIGSLSRIQGKHTGYKAKPLEKVENREKYVQSIEEKLEEYKNEKDSSIRIALKKSLDSLNEKETYYISGEGELYIKNA